MCGIHGILTPTFSTAELSERLTRMGNIQRHRGPDDSRETIFSTPGGQLGIGMVRLSILDLETGMQPITRPADGSAIVCNGQIYNYLELKTDELRDQVFTTKGDIEVALHLYQKYGLDFLRHLNGMYAGAIYDPVRLKLILFRDRFGIKPLYYTTWQGNFVFASEIKPLIHGSGLPAQLNTSRLPVYFTYRYLPGEETMFEHVKRLPPGAYLDYDLRRNQFTIARYWEYRLDREEPDMALDAAAEEFNALFTDAVRIRLRSDVEVGSLVSGGIDSSAVAAQAATIKPKIKLFTISFEENNYNELPQVEAFLAAQRDRFSQTKHYTRICRRQALEELPDIVASLEDPVSLGTVLPTDQVCRMTAEHLKVVLTGEGADEIFAGYRKFSVEMAAHYYADLSPKERDQLDEALPELKNYLAVRHPDPARRYIQSDILFEPDELQQLLGATVSRDLFPKDALPSLSGSEHPLNALLAFESRARLPDYVILRLDKLSMRHSLETRTPFLDYRLAEFAGRLPVRYKIDLNTMREKFICSYTYNNFKILDNKTCFRKKLPFTIPLADWLANPTRLPDILQEIMLGEKVKQQGILDPTVFKAHVKRVSSSGIGPATLVSEADRVFAVIMFTLWYERFMVKSING